VKIYADLPARRTARLLSDVFVLCCGSGRA